MATLINGDGNAAVYAAQDADYYAGVEGNVTKILPVGLKMAYEIEDANTIAIKNGVIITKEGRRIQLDAGSIDEFTIPTGSQGVTKYYIIGYHLYTDASSNQLCETFVQLMTSESETITENTFRGGSDEVYVSVYRVTQEGLTLTTIESLLPEGVAIGDFEGIIGDTDISGIGDGTLTGAASSLNASLTELINPPYVEVTADGVKTYRQVFNALYALIDKSKLSSKSKLKIMQGTDITVLSLMVITSGTIGYCYTAIVGSYLSGYVMYLEDGTSTYKAMGFQEGSATDLSTAVAPSGRVFRVEY